MASDRCPSCGATVRPGDPWCTLCWTDLRPKPAPPPPPAPAPVPVPVAAAGVAGLPGVVPAPVDPLTAPLAVVDPLTAPLAAVLGQPVAGDPEASPAVTWPCVECGNANAIDLNACAVCTTPFGGRILRLDDAKAVRRRYMLMAIGAVGVFLMLLAGLTFAMTDPSGVGDVTGETVELPMEDLILPEG